MVFGKPLIEEVVLITRKKIVTMYGDGCQLFARLVVIISQCMHIPSHYAVQLKLI